MSHFLNFSQLSAQQLAQHREIDNLAFPPIVQASVPGRKYWKQLEAYFPEFQIFLISNDLEVIGSMNAIPFQFDLTVDELPDDGWDWMLEKGINDFDTKKKANFLGGLQIIIKSKYQGLGYSRKIIHHAKEIFNSSGLKHFVIPIRPTKKQDYPEMSMSDYIDLKTEDKVYDPWLRTHLKCGAEIIKICHNSMNVQGDLPFWEKILGHKISESGAYLAKGALNPTIIKVDKSHGEYREPNVWIRH